MMQRAVVILLMLTIWGCGVGTKPSDSANVATPPEGQSQAAAAPAGAVQLSIVSFDGIEQRIAEKRGKVVVMDAWSTSCPPCLQEFHNLVELHRQYGPEKVACISLSFDYEGVGKPEEQQPAVMEFLEKQQATFDNLLSSDESDVLYRKFKLASVPAVFVYDREGKLRKRFDNEQAKSKEQAFTYEEVRALVSELLAEKPPGNP